MTFKDYFSALGDRTMIPTATKVSLIIGTLLFCLNHGEAVLKGKMTYPRWTAALLTYVVPYCVNVHGQLSGRLKQVKEESLILELEKQTAISDKSAQIGRS